MRMKGDTGKRLLEYSRQVRGILEIELADALEWLGNSTALSVHSLFPPPSYDIGYANLLGVGFQGAKNVGCIAHIGA